MEASLHIEARVGAEHHAARIQQIKVGSVNGTLEEAVYAGQTPPVTRLMITITAYCRGC